MRRQGECIIDKRLKFKKGLQKRFVKEIKNKSRLTWRALAEDINISERTLRIDWQKERTTIPYRIAELLMNRYPFGNKEEIFSQWVKQILPENWGQLLAGESNKKKIRIPQKSEELAEILGAILGDGHLERKTLYITGNLFEREHHIYLTKRIENLFGVSSKMSSILDRHTNILKVHSTELIRFLVGNGMVLGDKIKNKASLPDWIFNEKKPMFGALRGLFDTDGGIYYKQKRYKRAIIEFQTHSEYIRKDIIKLLKECGFTPSKSSKNIRIQNQEEIYKFFNLVGSANPKNIVRYQYFINKKEIPLKDKLIKDIVQIKVNEPFKAALV